jgi:predicted dehydrogenase
MATSIEDMQSIIAVQRASGKNYMMMETSVYGREYHAVRHLYRTGALGRITFYRGFHIQDLDGFPRYWLGYPPMAYITHALSPILALLSTRVSTVTCFGSGRLTPDRVGDYDNVFPLEVGLFRLHGSEVTADVTLSFFQTARSFLEGFSIYGDAMSVEWPDTEDGPLRTFELLSVEPGSRGRRCRVSELAPGDDLVPLPPEIVQFTRDSEYRARPGTAPTVVRAYHSGSHPYLVHEFVSSILEARPAAIDAPTAARWTAPGILAHQSAMNGGSTITVPAFEGE